MTNPLPSRIDVHSHFLPPNYHAELAENGHSNPDGMPAIPPWSPEAHLEMMSTANVSKSILSISSPGTNIAPGKPELARKLTRYCNSYAADLKKKHPDKFGFWASLPLPDVDASLQEIDQALAENCDGFALLTNYHGTYIGAPSLDPIFDKLNSINATIFIHPTKPYMGCCTTSPSSTEPIPALPFGDQYPVPMFEFLFDTARAVINLFVTGTIDRCPNITFIIPHAGGTLPPLLSRFTKFSHIVPGGRVLQPDTVHRQLHSNFYFDLAGLVFWGEEGGEGQLKALVQGCDISYQRLLYGSDFPFTPVKNVAELAERMREGLVHLFGEEERRAIYEGNAVGLLAGARSTTP